MKNSNITNQGLAFLAGTTLFMGGCVDECDNSNGRNYTAAALKLSAHAKYCPQNRKVLRIAPRGTYNFEDLDGDGNYDLFIKPDLCSDTVYAIAEDFIDSPEINRDVPLGGGEYTHYQRSGGWTKVIPREQANEISRLLNEYFSELPHSGEGIFTNRFGRYHVFPEALETSRSSINEALDLLIWGDYPTLDSIN